MNEEYQKEKRALDYLLEMHMKPEIKTACKNHISNEKIGLLIFRN